MIDTIEKKRVSFGTEKRDFTITLNKRVNQYFKDRKIGRHANAEMIIKTLVMFTLYFGPYLLIITETVTGILPILGLIPIMSIGAAGIGLSVMHDANHGAYSGNSTINKVIGRSLELLGGSSFNWKMQHNVLHHTYTNVHEEDEDIDPRGVLRFSPHSKWKKMHRFQHIYAWFLYGMMTIVWVFVKDFNRLNRYHKTGLVKKQKADIRTEWTILIGSKVLYIGYMFVIPVLITPYAWWQILLGIFMVHYFTGFILAIIFQPAHVIEGTEFPLPDENNSLEHNWAIHQLYTTMNFGNRSRWFSWYVGGLNFQIEHHLFPGVCHVHYRAISNIVQETAREFELPYKSTKTFFQALNGHFRLLKRLGTKPA